MTNLNAANRETSILSSVTNALHDTVLIHPDNHDHRVSSSSDPYACCGLEKDFAFVYAVGGRGQLRFMNSKSRSA
jgi:mRNA-degrading endonuclease YafQ of YafQ-DinJ toxin-antitoxin module